MSLRSFHLIFILIATLFAFAVAMWAFYFGAGENDGVILSMGWMCAAAALILPVYGVRFYFKSRREHLTL